MYKKSIFLFTVIVISSSIRCSEPLKNKVMQGMWDGAKVGGKLTLLCTIPTVVFHTASSKEKLAFPVICSFFATIGGALLGGAFARLKSKNFDWSAARGGVISGTAATMTAWLICYLDKVRIF